MAVITIPGMFLTGDHASRPAANAVGSGSIYSCSTHSLIYQSDGSSWSTWATLGGTETLPATTFNAKGDLISASANDTPSVVTVGANDTILMADSGQTAGLKWVAAGTPSDLDYDDVAATGSADTFSRGDHVHGMPSAAGGGGSLVLLEQHTASASAELDFTSFISSTYDEYVCEIVGLVPATNGVNLLWRAGTGGGPTYDTGGNYHGGLTTDTGAGGSGAISNRDAGASSLMLVKQIGNNAQFGQASATLRLTNPQSTSLSKHIMGISVWHNGSEQYNGRLGGMWNSASAMTAMRFYLSSGNITSGVIRVYGLEK